MKITELSLKGVRILEPRYFEDYRGYYCETYSARTMREFGVETVFVQDNHSFSQKKWTLRGIHFQVNPKPQIKLVRCTRGRVLDVVVDLKNDSPTFRKWISVELSAENRRQIWIPHGYGHAFLTLEDNCEIQYKTDEFYYPEYDRSVAWNDPDISVEWPEGMQPVISQKDMDAPRLADSDVNFTVKENG